MTALRVVFDSNVIISGFLFGGPPARLLQLALDGSVQMVSSLPILDEIRDVLQRPKFGLSIDQVLMFINELHTLSEVVVPQMRFSVITADPDDDMILECAFAANADMIVSGDAHLLTLGCWETILILSPAEALKRLVAS